MSGVTCVGVAGLFYVYVPEEVVLLLLLVEWWMISSCEH